jgi:hypothetical protein
MGLEKLLVRDDIPEDAKVLIRTEIAEQEKYRNNRKKSDSGMTLYGSILMHSDLEYPNCFAYVSLTSRYRVGIPSLTSSNIIGSGDLSKISRYLNLPKLEEDSFPRFIINHLDTQLRLLFFFA